MPLIKEYFDGMEEQCLSFDLAIFTRGFLATRWLTFVEVSLMIHHESNTLLQLPCSHHSLISFYFKGVIIICFLKH